MEYIAERRTGSKVEMAVKSYIFYCSVVVRLAYNEHFRKIDFHTLGSENLRLDE